MRRYLYIAAILLVLGLFSSCADMHDPEDSSYILAAGIDMGNADGIRLTLEIQGDFISTEETPNIHNGGLVIDSAGNNNSITAEAKSFYEAINIIEASLSRKLDFAHLQFLAFSEKYAKAGLIEACIYPLMENYKIRKSACLVITRCPANSFLSSVLSSSGIKLSKTQYDLNNQINKTGFFPAVTLGDFYNALKSDCDQPVAALASVNSEKVSFSEDTEHESDTEAGFLAGEMPRKGGMNIELFGTAIFDGFTMIGELNGEETRLMLAARGEYKGGIFNIKDPDDSKLTIPIKIEDSKAKIHVETEGQKPVIRVKISFTGHFLGFQGKMNSEKNEMKSIIENAFNKYTKSELDALMDKCQNLKADVFKFGDKASPQFLTITELQDYNWKEHFSEADINTEVKLRIKSTSTVLNGSSS